MAASNWTVPVAAVALIVTFSSACWIVDVPATDSAVSAPTLVNDEVTMLDGSVVPVKFAAVKLVSDAPEIAGNAPVRFDELRVPVSVVAYTSRHRKAVVPMSLVAVTDGTSGDARREVMLNVSVLASPNVTLPFTARSPGSVTLPVVGMYDASSHTLPVSYHSLIDPLSLVSHLRPAVPAAGREESVDDCKWMPVSAS